MVKKLLYSLPTIPNSRPYIAFIKSNVRLTGNYHYQSAKVEARYNSDSAGEEICLIFLNKAKKLFNGNQFWGDCNSKPYNGYLLYSLGNQLVVDSLSIRTMLVITDYQQLAQPQGLNEGHRTHIELQISTTKHNSECDRLVPGDEARPRCASAYWGEILPVAPN